MNWPKVSVIISTYDRPEMLRRALESVLGQTFRDYEVLVMDDGSDTAISVVRDLAQDFADIGVTIRCANLEYNTGYQSAPKNAGILSSEGSYIAYLDDDNEWDPDHLWVLVDEIEKGSADLVYSRWRYKGEGPGSGNDSPYCPAFPAAMVGLTAGPQFNFIDTSAILHSKAAIANLVSPKPWNEEIRRFGDWDLIRRCVLSGVRMRAVDSVTFTYWWHGENLQLTRSVSNDDLPRAPQHKWSGGDSVWRG